MCCVKLCIQRDPLNAPLKVMKLRLNETERCLFVKPAPWLGGLLCAPSAGHGQQRMGPRHMHHKYWYKGLVM